MLLLLQPNPTLPVGGTLLRATCSPSSSHRQITRKLCSLGREERERGVFRNSSLSTDSSILSPDYLSIPPACASAPVFLCPVPISHCRPIGRVSVVGRPKTDLIGVGRVCVLGWHRPDVGEKQGQGQGQEAKERKNLRPAQGRTEKNQIERERKSRDTDWVPRSTWPIPSRTDPRAFLAPGV